MRYAIGALELNPFEVLGDPLFPKRYCSQVILPLIGMLEDERRLRLTLTTTGSAIEYLAENHLLVLKRIRRLIEEGRIELLCSMYTNADWHSFPSSDLLKSHRMTDAILCGNGLPARRTMVAQHNTHWPATRVFQREFDVFLVRDTFLRGRHAARAFSQMARVGNSLLVVAANNLLHDVAAHFVKEKVTDAVGLFTEGRLETAVESWPHSDPRFVDITIGEDDWHWIHSGGAHHFTAAGGLRNWEAFFCDPDWMGVVQDFITAKLDEGWAFGLVSEFTDSAGTQLEKLPDLGSDSWAYNAGSDHAYWLGEPEQRVRAVMSWTSLSWRSRAALRKAEAMLHKAGCQSTSEALRENVEALWRHQLWTEVPPAASRGVLPCEVEFVREHAEQVISAGAGLCFQLQPHAGEAFDENMGAFKPGAGMVETELINGEGTVKWCCNGNGIHRCEAQFSAEEPTCGIGFKLSSDSIEFSSCGQEDKVEKMALTSFGEEGGILLSPTGLYSLGKDLYLIRHNRHVSVGAQAGNGGTFLRFVVDFAPEGRQFEWPVHDR